MPEGFGPGLHGGRAANHSDEHTSTGQSAMTESHDWDR